MPRRILVTGGAGFIGSHLVERLVAAGERVAVLDDLSGGRREWLHEDAELHEVDVRDADAVVRAIAQAASDVVVHLAANVAQRGLERAPEAAGLNHDGQPKLRFHDLRHGFASAVDRAGRERGLDSRQLSHASPRTTLNAYVHMFPGEEHADRMRSSLEESFGAILSGERGTSGEQNAPSPQVPAAGADSAQLCEIGHHE
jgi:integrase